MEYFQRNIANDVRILLVNAGTPVTGETDATITCYIRKQTGSAAVQSLTGLVTEIDATNMPGEYIVSLPSSVFDVDGLISMHFSGGTFDTYTVLGDIGFFDYMLDIRALGLAGYKLSSPLYDGAGNLTSATLECFNPNADVNADTPRFSISITAQYNINNQLTGYEAEEV